MSTIFRSHIARMLQKTLVKVSVDEAKSTPMYAHKIFRVRGMSDAFVDFYNIGGPGLASVKPEGVEMATGTITPGYTTRVYARTYALKLIITEETLEDNKYEDALRAKRHLSRAMYNTIEVDAANVLVRGWDTSYVWGDSQPWFSASHTIPGGATWSNTAAVPQAPSVQAITDATSAITKYPGLDGIVTPNLRPTQPVCPTEQWASWSAILNSKFNPAPGNFTQINVVNHDLNLKPAIANPFWDNTETNWIMLTNCEDRIELRYRRRPRSANWVNNDRQCIIDSTSGRWCFAMYNPRCAWGSQA